MRNRLFLSYIAIIWRYFIYYIIMFKFSKIHKRNFKKEEKFACKPLHYGGSSLLHHISNRRSLEGRREVDGQIISAFVRANKPRI